jgi:hypothetical protein
VENTWQNCGFESHPLENFYSRIAQGLERLADNKEVGGSIPPVGTYEVWSCGVKVISFLSHRKDCGFESRQDCSSPYSISGVRWIFTPVGSDRHRLGVHMWVM